MADNSRKKSLGGNNANPHAAGNALGLAAFILTSFYILVEGQIEAGKNASEAIKRDAIAGAPIEDAVDTNCTSRSDAKKATDAELAHKSQAENC